jgi:DNA-binding transcriptional regulator of glucitol operon
VIGGVRPTDRRRDTAALILLLVGAALVVTAHIGMQQLSQGNVTLAKGEWQMNRYNRYDRMSTLGGGTVIAGILIGVWSMSRYLFYRRAARNAEKNRP